MKISFCTQILNRFWQLSKTVEHNLKVLEGTIHEWVILDLGSDDGIILPTHPNLKYIRVERPEQYHISKAKNCSLKLGTGDYLFSLDADNFIDKDLINAILAEPLIPHHGWSGKQLDGTVGRIGAPTKLWESINYFEESMNPVGFHDLLAISRFKLLTKHLGRSTPIPAILNTKEHTAKFTGGNWRKMSQENSRIVSKNLSFIPNITVDLPAHSFGTKDGWVHTIHFYQQKYKKMSYGVEFCDNFDWGLGGKLPGLGGGRLPMGGMHSFGFSVRLMWRKDGAAEAYVYRKSTKTKYGESIPLGTFGKTNFVSLEFLDGIMSVTLNQHTVNIDVEYPMVHADLLQVFRGGHSPEWSSKFDNTIRIFRQ